MTTRNNDCKIDGRSTKPATSPTWVDKPTGSIAAVLLLLLLLYSLDGRLTVSHAVYSCAKLSSDATIVYLVYLAGLPGCSTCTACLSSAVAPRAWSFMSQHVVASSSLSHKLFINNFAVWRLFAYRSVLADDSNSAVYMLSTAVYRCCHWSRQFGCSGQYAVNQRINLKE